MQRSSGRVLTGGRNVTLVSWNVKGLGHAIKREKVFRHLKSLSADVIFLQETHIKATEQRRLQLQLDISSLSITIHFSRPGCGHSLSEKYSIPILFNDY